MQEGAHRPCIVLSYTGKVILSRSHGHHCVPEQPVPATSPQYDGSVSRRLWMADACDVPKQASGYLQHIHMWVLRTPGHARAYLSGGLYTVENSDRYLCVRALCHQLPVEHTASLSRLIAGTRQYSS